MSFAPLPNSSLYRHEIRAGGAGVSAFALLPRCSHFICTSSALYHVKNERKLHI
jgi:hypothetical protein